MLQSRLIRLGSLLTIIGAVLLLLNLLGIYGIYIPRFFFTLYQNPGFLAVYSWFTYAAPLASDLCFLVGLVALLLLQRSGWGRLAAGAAVFGEALAVATRGLFIWPFNWGFTWFGGAAFSWYDTLSSLAGGLIALGILGCGTFTLIARVLPRWNAAPLLLGLWLAFSGIRALLGPRSFFIFYASYGPPTPPQGLWVFILLGTTSLFLWGSLGVGLWPGKAPEIPALPQVEPVIVPTP